MSRSPQSHHTASSPSPAASTTVTTPDQSSGDDGDIWDDTTSEHGDDHGRYDGDVGDVFDGSRQNHTTTTTDDNNNNNDNGGGGGIETNRRPQQRQILSEVPQLRRQHVTDGYREGLSVGKANVMQRGFDSGYPFGVEIGSRVGKVFGVLEGILEGLGHNDNNNNKKTWAQKRSDRKGAEDKSEGERINLQTEIETVVKDDTVIRNVCPLEPEGSPFMTVQKLYEEAKVELKISELMKNLDDSMLDRMGQFDVDEDDNNNNNASTETKPQVTSPLPKEIDQVITKWEDLVLKSLR